MVKAIYPGSFDPPTKGHVDIVTRACALFEKITMGVYDAPPKDILFSTRERVELLQEAVSHLPNVEVRPFSGLVVHLAHQVGAKVVVRGLRPGYDFDYEFEMALMNRKLDPDIEIVVLMSALEYQFISSSRIKEVAQLGGNVEDFVPKNVLPALKAKLQAPVSQTGGKVSSKWISAV